MNSNNQEFPSNNNNSKINIIESRYPRKSDSQSEKVIIMEYEGYNTLNYQRSKNKIDINKNYRRNISKNEINKKSNNDTEKIDSLDCFSEKEGINHHRNLSLNKGIKTNSASTIELKVKNKRNNVYNLNQNGKKKQNSNKNNVIKISGFELCYESDNGEINLNINKLNNNRENIKNYYKCNNFYYNNINPDDMNKNKKMNNIYKTEKNAFRYEIKHNNLSNYNKTQNRINNNNYLYKNTLSNNKNNSLSTINTSKRISKNKIKIKEDNTYNRKSYISIRNSLNQDKKIIKFRNYHRPSEIKKIILIQTAFRAYKSRLKVNNYTNIIKNCKEFFDILNNIIINKKKNLWKYFKLKIKGNKKNIKRNNNEIIINKKKIVLKANKINKLHKKIGDSFNKINDELKIKLDDIIKENKDLKNQIFDNKNIEEKMKQLLEENKKNQSINEIIMKDNRELARRLKNIQDNRNNQLVIQNQLPVDLTQPDDKQTQSNSKLKYLSLKCIFFKKALKDRNSLKIYFNKYRNNIKKLKKKYSIENNNIFINNKKKINIQMAKNLNINFISPNDNYKHFLLFKLFTKKEQKQFNIVPKYFYKYYYISNITNKETIEEIDTKKRRILKSLVDKKENNNKLIKRNIIKQWKLRGKIFKMKGAQKELKRRKKLKKKIRDKIAKEALNNLKNKTATFQSAHEFSYKIDKIDKKEDIKEENISKENEQIESDGSF